MYYVRRTINIPIFSFVSTRKNSSENRKTSKMIVSLIITFQTNLIDSSKKSQYSLTSFEAQPSYDSQPRPRAERGEGGEKKNIDPSRSILEALTQAVKNNPNLLTNVAFAALPSPPPLSRDGTRLTTQKMGRRARRSGIITRGLLR